MKKILILFCMLGISFGILAENKSYNNSGYYNFTVPLGVTSISATIKGSTSSYDVNAGRSSAFGVSALGAKNVRYCRHRTWFGCSSYSTRVEIPAQVKTITKAVNPRDVVDIFVSNGGSVSLSWDSPSGALKIQDTAGFVPSTNTKATAAKTEATAANTRAEIIENLMTEQNSCLYDSAVPCSKNRVVAGTKRFTSNGTFTVPRGVTKLNVVLQSSGGKSDYRWSRKLFNWNYTSWSRKGGDAQFGTTFVRGGGYNCDSGGSKRCHTAANRAPGSKVVVTKKVSPYETIPVLANSNGITNGGYVEVTWNTVINDFK